MPLPKFRTWKNCLLKLWTFACNVSLSSWRTDEILLLFICSVLITSQLAETGSLIWLKVNLDLIRFDSTSGSFRSFSTELAMKLLESSRFEVLNSALFVKTGDSRIVGRCLKESRLSLSMSRTFRPSLFSTELRATRARWSARTSSSTKSSPPRRRGGRRTLSRPCPRPKTVTEDTPWARGKERGRCRRLTTAATRWTDWGDVSNRKWKMTCLFLNATYRKTICATASPARRFSISFLPWTPPFPTTTLGTRRRPNSAKSPAYRWDPHLNIKRGRPIYLRNHIKHVVNNVDNLLSVTASDHYSGVHDSLWTTLNEEIALPECNIYSYNPDLQSGAFDGVSRDAPVVTPLFSRRSLWRGRLLVVVQLLILQPQAKAHRLVHVQSPEPFFFAQRGPVPSGTGKPRLILKAWLLDSHFTFIYSKEDFDATLQFEDWMYLGKIWSSLKIHVRNKSTDSKLYFYNKIRAFLILLKLLLVDFQKIWTQRS